MITMIKVLFICHGNICRSTMCQFVFMDLVNKQGLSDEFYVDSVATSREEIGNDIHYGTKHKLREMNIPFTFHAARQVTKQDLEKFDYLIGMDQNNIIQMKRMLGNSPKILRLLDLSSHPRDIADPWYTGNFDITYEDVKEGCEVLLKYCQSKLN